MKQNRIIKVWFLLILTNFFVFTLSAQETEIYLSDMVWTYCEEGWGTTQLDKSIDGNTITLNNVTYSKGIGTHAIADIRYDLNGNYSRFRSDIGVDDEKDGTHADITFEVWIDGTKIYDSGIMEDDTATISIDLDISGAGELQLVVTDAGDGIGHDHADWADARVVETGSSTPAPTNVPTPDPTLTPEITPDPTPTQGTTPDPTLDPTPEPSPPPTGEPGVNLALNKPVEVSGNSGYASSPESAVDGDTGTRWASDWEDPSWIYVDLGAVYEIYRVVLNWHYNYGVAYQVQVSDDASNWSDIYSTTTGNGGIDDLSVAGNGRYVRMYGTQRKNRYAYSLYEFEVYGGGGEPTLTPTIEPTGTPAIEPTPTQTPDLTPTPTADPTPTQTQVPSPTPTEIPTESPTPGSGERVIINFNTGWLYEDSDVSNGQSPSLNDSGWEDVCVPHANRIIRHRYDSDAEFRFISWYRKHYIPLVDYDGQRFLIDFQAVATVAQVYVNGELIGEHKGAYTAFTYDITDHLIINQDNVIAVRVDSRRRTDIPPEGSTVDYMIFGGIVRDVSLLVVNPLHLEWVFVSSPTVSQNSAVVNAKTKVVNDTGTQKSCTVITTIKDNNNNTVATASSTHDVPANSSYEFNHNTGTISNPQLWHPDNPYLYTVYTGIQDNSVTVDDHYEKMGIRSVFFDESDSKFYINGQVLKLRGLNRHETYPFVGRAVSNRLQAKDAEILKYDLGCNTVRCSHYPQDPDFFRRCDEIGLMAIEEVPGWQHIGNSSWQQLLLQALEEMIIRDRNHPSIISFGVRVNESEDNQSLYTQTNNLARTLDPTRQTHGVRRSNSSTSSFLEDIWTRNFSIPSGFPNPSPWFTTETVGHNFPTHSWDDNQRLVDHMLEHVDRQTRNYQNNNLVGVLGWCAFDYNSSHPNAVDLEGGSYVSYHGVADIYRIPKVAGYLFQSQRDPDLYGPMVYITNRWEGNLSGNYVYVVSNCDQVELFVNGSSKGRISPNQATALPQPLFRWSTSYQSGEIRAEGYIGGNLVATHTRHTPGNPVQVVLTPDHTTLYDGGDMTRIVVTVIDEYGQVVPRAGNTVNLSATGAGDFIGESSLVLEDGKGAFYVKTRANQTGTINCQANSSGLVSDNITITVVSR